jgi:ribosome-associated protein
MPEQETQTDANARGSLRFPPDFPDSELTFEAVHASGPGGQNINKVATAIRLTYDPEVSSFLDPAARERLRRIAGSRIDRQGRISILARRFRTQEQNRRDALDRLMRMISAAREEPILRRSTRPTRSAQLRRLQNKTIRKRIKQSRRQKNFED